MATINKISTNCSQKLRMRSVNALLKIFVRPVMGGGGLNPHQPPPEYATVTALILRFFADFDFFAGQIRHSG